MSERVKNMIFGAGIVIFAILSWQMFGTYKEVEKHNQQLIETMGVVNNISRMMTEHIENEEIHCDVAADPVD